MVNIFLFSLRDEAKKKKRTIQEAKFEKKLRSEQFFCEEENLQRVFQLSFLPRRRINVDEWKMENIDRKWL